MRQPRRLLQPILCHCLLVIGVWAMCPPADLKADDALTRETTPEKIEFFETHVRPLLVKECIGCHGPKKQHGGLRLDSRAAMLTGGDSGGAFDVKHLDESLLLQAVRRESVEMPPEKELTKKEIGILEKWIRDGAAWPKSKTSEDESKPNFEAHWAFQPIGNPKVPEVRNESWIANDIDKFILHKLEASGLAPSKRASKAILFRRMKWDLVGMPTTFDEVRKFVTNESSQSTANVVDHFLASQHYGERWGRYWLDLARFADTKGYVFFEKPDFRSAYTYRDYVINSFNNDKPFDEFVVEQLAADKLQGKVDHESLAAVGFITVGPRFKNDVHDILADRIDVVSRGLLGLTVSCARCHDHKYDPVSMEDYYSLYGVFNNSIEPLHWPFREGEKVPEKYREQADKIERAARDLDNHYREKYKRIVEQARKRLPEYLAAAQARRKGPDTTLFDVIVDGDDLSPQLLLIWQQYLVESERKQDPVFLPWNELAKLDDDQFAKLAPEVLKKLAASANEKPVNKRVFHRLVEKRPATFADVVSIYIELFDEADVAWRTANKEGATRLANGDQEALRIVLYGSRSPLQTPYHGFKLLRLFPDRESQKKVQELNAALDAARAAAPPELAQFLVVEDAPSMIEPRVFRRGNPSAPGDYVTRQYLKFFSNVSDQPFEVGSGRLELAQAIVSPRNPLTARVLVNRIWQHHFGQGLVTTPSDFGLQSEPPSHPELLDHLATWFVKHGWSIKKLHRYIMASATYQQQSNNRPECEAIDPANRLCWKMDRRRLDFEAMRDAILFVSGELDFAVGGPSVARIMSDSNRRRTIYTHIDRQNLPGVMRTFDFPPPDVSSGSRNKTTVPGQSLFLMNHPFVLSASRSLGDTAENCATIDEGVRFLYQQLYHRNPTTQETDDIKQFLRKDQQFVSPKVTPKPTNWKYGYASLQNDGKKLVGFQPLPHWTGAQYQGGDRLPDGKLGWVFLNKSGGHPGNNLDHVAVMRWTAPEDISVSIKGLFKHAKQPGDGVRGRLFAGGRLLAGPWVVHQKSVETNLESVALKKGETIDFVVDIYKVLNSDSFEWSPTITAVDAKAVAVTGANEPGGNKAKSWNYSTDFRAVEAEQITSWQSVAQILLLSNEFQFVN